MSPSILLRYESIDPSADESRALFLAASSGHLSVVETLLVDPRTNPLSSNQRALHVAYDKGHVDVASLLVSVSLKCSLTN